MDMDFQNVVRAHVDFNANQIDVTIEHDEGQEELRGDLLVLAFFILRILSITKNSAGRDAVIAALKLGTPNIDSFTEQIFEEYSDEYGYDKVSPGLGATGDAKKGFSLTLEYNKEEHRNRFIPRGFGALGKAIEFHSFIAIFMICQFILQKYKDPSTLHKINYVVIASSMIIEKLGKLSAENEYRFVESIVHEAEQRA